ncbi:MAG TPA: hypothetical protein VEZ47_03295, partial [Gemmatirosa sp.]|nr:hypothetical protein [Gemmatirosa sp.]
TVGGRAARRVALLARLPHLALDPGAALVSGVAPALATGATLDGGDAAPPDWTDCVGAPDPRDAARLPPGVSPTGDGTILGALREDASALDADAYRRFAETDWGMLTARADVRVEAGGALTPLPAAVGGHACAPGTWGEPWRGAGAVGPCTVRLPVIHVRGEGRTTLRAPARWQGVLLVDGDLVVEGQVEGVGLVVVQGRVDATAGALLLHGALLARQGVLLGPGSRVVRSRCALERAARAAGKPIAYGRRAWLDVTP